MDPNGYYNKFIVTRRDTGEEVTDPTFTLIPGRDKHAAAAVLAYAYSVEGENAQLAADLRALVA